MAKKPSPDARTEQLICMVTKSEKEAVKHFAGQMGMTMSTAGRYLLRRGLEASKVSFTEGE